jgi:glycosyltransferase involved in cell wall biosynthesis
MGLPAHHWKWRMRHAALTMAEMVNGRVASGENWDLLVASDMLDLAQFAGLTCPAVHRLPRMVYFHENQLTYPVRQLDPRDLHFAVTNLASALAATRVWFNSAFHRDSFLEALANLLSRMPDHPMPAAVEQIGTKSDVEPPGVHWPGPRGPRQPGPLRILWAARWEHDKNPDGFFQAIEILGRRGIDFRLNVVGEQFRDVPEVFAWAKEQFAGRIDRWGYQGERSQYEAALQQSDVIVSTALHEFFGISVVEAIAAGCRPLVPHRLAYPEILAPLGDEAGDFLYDGSPDVLADRLEELAADALEGDLWQGDPTRAARAVARLDWRERAPAMDAALEAIAGG